ncbi:MAG: hypothetical protein WD061_02560 [Candidatus Saccharimonadales bacterium]
MNGVGVDDVCEMFANAEVDTGKAVFDGLRAINGPQAKVDKATGKPVSADSKSDDIEPTDTPTLGWERFIDKWKAKESFEDDKTEED